MKKYELKHLSEVGVKVIVVTENDIVMDITVPNNDVKKAKELGIGEHCSIHYGNRPVKIGILTRKE